MTEETLHQVLLSPSADLAAIIRPRWVEQLGEGVRQMIAGAEEATAWLRTQRPAARQDRLILEVRCPSRAVLLSAYLVPAGFAADATRRVLVLAGPKVRYPKSGDPVGPLWLMGASDEWVLCCRCHANSWLVSADDMPGGSQPSPARVVLS